MLKKCVLVAVAPLYEQAIWFEQILDYVSEKPNSIILLPKISTADGNDVETNLIYEILAKQFSNIEYYEVCLDDSTKVYQADMLENHKQAAGKMCQYIQFEQNTITLKDMNRDVNYLLAKQYDVFLDDALKADYQIMQEQLLSALMTKIAELATKEVIVLVDIEHAFSTRIRIKQQEQIDFYVYGDCEDEDEDE